MVIVDTSVWIDYLADTSNPQTVWVTRNVEEQELGLTDLILCELLQGARSDAAFTRLRRTLSFFEIFNTGGAEIAIASAQNYRLLRDRGFTVRKTIDAVIATFCIREGHSLLHRDRDFDLFEEHLGLTVIHV
jgi:predicted nucleic acid-binding protein